MFCIRGRKNVPECLIKKYLKEEKVVEEFYLFISVKVSTLGSLL